MRDELIALLEEHCGTIRSEAEKIDACLQNFGTDPRTDQMHEAIYLVHKIKGGSGALGFLPLSQSANALEYALRDLNQQPDRAAGLAEIHDLSTAFQRKILEMRPENSSLHESEAMGRA